MLWILIFYMFIVWTGHCDYDPPPCNIDYNCNFKNGSRCGSNAFTFIRNSGECNRLQATYPSIRDGSNPCDPKDLDVSITTGPKLFEDFYPHLFLNITPSVYSPITLLFVRLQCYHAVKLPDLYCSDLAEVPCKAWSVIEPAALQYPFSISFPCFSPTEDNTYLITVSTAPQNCTFTFAVSAPHVSYHSPDVTSFYAGDNRELKPLVIVDLTPEDGIWLRYHRADDSKNEAPASQKPVVFVVCLGEYEKDCPKVFEKMVEPPTTGVKWTNVEMGNYTAVAIVHDSRCTLDCSDCNLCANHSVKFTIHKDKFTLSHRSLRAVQDFAKMFVFGLLIVLVVVATVVFIFVMYKRHTIRRRGVEEREMTLVSCPKVLIVYSYDCPEHSACILALARFLMDHANASVILDQFELNAPGVVPARWLVDAFVRVDFVIALFSEGAVEVLNGKSLKRDLPFPDLFDIAMNHILAELTAYISARGYFQPAINTRFIFAHFSYSPASVIQPQFTAFPVRTLCLPNQLGELIALLHNELFESGVVHRVNDSCFDTVVKNVKEMRRNHPSWLSERIIEQNENVGSDQQLNSAALLKPQDLEGSPLLLNHLEQEEQFGVEPPDDESEKEMYERADEEFPLVQDSGIADSMRLEEDKV